MFLSEPTAERRIETRMHAINALLNDPRDPSTEDQTKFDKDVIWLVNQATTRPNLHFIFQSKAVLPSLFYVFAETLSAECSLETKKAALAALYFWGNVKRNPRAHPEDIDAIKMSLLSLYPPDAMPPATTPFLELRGKTRERFFLPSPAAAVSP